MIEYKVLADDPQKGLVVQGNFAPGSIPVNIPHSNPKRKQYISLFLNLRDIEAGIDYLQCISPNNHLRINEGLFISALALSAKCFVTSESRIGLDKQGFKKYSPQSKPIFDRYDAWRNKHFLHDENSMTEAIAFLLVSPAGSENVFGGSPSVVWNSVQVNYLQEGKQLESLLQEIRKYIMSSIDKKGDSIAQEYCNCTREEFINDQMATQIIEHITYNKLDAAYDTDIFTSANLRGKLGLNAMEANRSLYSHIIYDSENEKRFAGELDVNAKVAVYVKLPGGFFISTPVGKYNPDWAIAFNEGSVKHIYFIAETKGNCPKFAGTC